MEITGPILALAFAFGFLYMLFFAKLRSKMDGSNKSWGVLISEVIQAAIEKGESNLNRNKKPPHDP